ncbi:histidine kinase dimerization/phosphoacceptor domain -containing protein [Porifericola rhodea]|uniref:histidine kinase dimerization/phosphoacceptor domain -containing protein n=1 Tax=Porifericola rhodea TaxID=930972 RepID=UPI0026656114|nr:histidine kinase dimerization/phosphoacceptor domain -containing protein [Porifericola rhodea]WKN30057.1 histidine kinase dimerization/phosphoacceptor domain -containing protein [Porifericola rhodea]
MSESPSSGSTTSKSNDFEAQMQKQTAFQFIENIKQHLSDGYCVTDQNGIIVDFNEIFCHTFGYKREELLDKSFIELLPAEMRAYAIMLHHEYLDGQSDENAAEWTFQHKEGHPLQLRSITSRIVSSQDKRYKMEILVPMPPHQATDLEEHIKKMQHQFKNTLHEISGLLHLQSVQLQSEAKEVVTNSQKRVLAIAIAFELLYKGEEPDSIDLEEYLPKLLGQLQINSKLTFEQESIFWQANRAYALGIVLVECFNSIKEELLANQKIKIIAKQEADEFVLELKVKNMPNTQFPAFSKQLINALGRQLQADVKIGESAQNILSLRCPL